MFIQLMTFIERVGQKRVGFWCWKLFIINYFRSYEVNYNLYIYLNFLLKYYKNHIFIFQQIISLLIILFLKIIEISDSIYDVIVQYSRLLYLDLNNKSVFFNKQNCIHIYAACLLIICFVLIMNTASSVNYEANKSYKLLNSLMAYQLRGRIMNKRNSKRFSKYYLIRSNIKVTNIIFNKFCISVIFSLFQINP